MVKRFEQFDLLSDKPSKALVGPVTPPVTPPVNHPVVPTWWQNAKALFIEMVANGVPIAISSWVVGAIICVILCGATDTCTHVRMRDDKCANWCDRNSSQMKQDEYLACFDKCEEWKVQYDETR